MKNEIMKNYINKEIFSAKYNYDQILLNSSKQNRRKKLGLIVGTAALLVVSSLSVSLINKKPQTVNSNDSISYKISTTKTGYGMLEDSYSEKVNMDYVSQDGISMKVDSIVITDDHFEAILNIKLEKEIENLTSDYIFLDGSHADYNSDNFELSYAIYDENNIIYGVNNSLLNSRNTGKIENPYSDYVAKELGITLDGQHWDVLQDSGNLGILSKNDNDILYKIGIDTYKGFPRSKQITIRLTSLGCSTFYIDNGEFVKEEPHYISDAEWIFKIDVPEKFYEREITILALENDIDELEIEKFEISETGLVITCTYPGIGQFISDGRFIDNFGDQLDEYFHITNKDGNHYKAESLTTVGDDKISASFNLTKNDIDNGLLLHVNGNTSKIINK